MDSFYVDAMAITSSSPGEIHGSKWYDLNADGIRDAGESGLANWTIFLDNDNDGILDAGSKTSLHWLPFPACEQSTWRDEQLHRDIVAQFLGFLTESRSSQ